MKMEEVIKCADELRNNIQTKYNKMLSELDQLKKEQDNISSEYITNTKQYQEEQRQCLSRIIDEKENAIQEWLDKQETNIENWLNNRIDEITKSKTDKESNEKVCLSDFVENLAKIEFI